MNKLYITIAGKSNALSALVDGNSNINGSKSTILSIISYQIIKKG